MMTYRKIYGDQQTQIERMCGDGWTIEKDSKHPVTLAYREARSNKFKATIEYKIYLKNQCKPIDHCLSRDFSRVYENFNYRITQFQKREIAKIKKREEKKTVKASDHWQVGDVIYNSWGYEQTNIDFYQVTKVLSKSIKIRPLAQNSSDHGGPHGGKCSPIRNKFIGDEQLKRIDSHYIKFQHGGGFKWEGNALYCSSYY